MKGQILFSPVDGFDPYGLVDIFIITPGEYLNYAMPSLGMVTMITICVITVYPQWQTLSRMEEIRAMEKMSSYFPLLDGNDSIKLLFIPSSWALISLSLVELIKS